MRRAIPALLAILLAGSATLVPAWAEDRPTLVPTRDVSVTYRLSAPQGERQMNMSWLAAEQKLRVDMPGGMGWSVVDQRAQKVFMVMERQRVIMEMPMQNGPGGLSIPTQPLGSARFSRAGNATVAGLACTLWRYQDGEHRGEVCATEDGVALRSTGTREGQTGSAEATAVAYGPQDPARFRLPSGYQTMPMPGPGAIMPPGAGGRPPAR